MNDDAEIVVLDEVEAKEGGGEEDDEDEIMEVEEVKPAASADKAEQAETKASETEASVETIDTEVVTSTEKKQKDDSPADEAREETITNTASMETESAQPATITDEAKSMSETEEPTAKSDEVQEKTKIKPAKPPSKPYDVPAVTIPKGKCKSGRFWKSDRDRFRSVKKGNRGLLQSFEQRLRQKDEKQRAKAMEEAMKEEKKRKAEELKKRQEENKKRREENERKAEVVQAVRNLNCLTLINSNCDESAIGVSIISFSQTDLACIHSVIALLKQPAFRVSV